jgi:hypothetical protein
MSIILLFLAGAAGALTKEIVKDNSLELPKFGSGQIFLGFLGSCVIGGVTGALVDHNPVLAFTAGFTGMSVAENLLPKKTGKNEKICGVVEQIIRKVAKEQGVDPDLAVRVAKCESGLNDKAKHVNTDGSIDRGLFQINNKYHPEVLDEEAFNPVLATEFFCKAFKEGNLSWWSATKTCWDK